MDDGHGLTPGPGDVPLGREGLLWPNGSGRLGQGSGRVLAELIRSETRPGLVEGGQFVTPAVDRVVIGVDGDGGAEMLSQCGGQRDHDHAVYHPLNGGELPPDGA